MKGNLNVVSVLNTKQTTNDSSAEFADKARRPLPPDDLFLSLRPALAIGLLLAASPFGGVLRCNEDKLPVLRFVHLSIILLWQSWEIFSPIRYNV